MAAVPKVPKLCIKISRPAELSSKEKSVNLGFAPRSESKAPARRPPVEKKKSPQKSKPESLTALRSQALGMTSLDSPLPSLPPAEEVQLNPDQLNPDQLLVLSLRHSKTLLFSAGPGAGKTFTLINLAQTVCQDNPNARVLALMFNVAAETSFQNRVGSACVRKAAYDPYAPPPGICCLTFDKFASKVVGSSGGSGATIKAKVAPVGVTSWELNRQLALEILQQNPITALDYLIIDEAQDVTKDYVTLCQVLMASAAHTVLAGDPRQELYAGSGWFSCLWSQGEGNSNISRVALRYNHRSNPAIVEFLNCYSRRFFPTLHHDQLPARPPTKTPAVFVHRSVDQAATLFNGCSSVAPSEVYGIVPVSLSKFSKEAAAAAAVGRLGQAGLKACLLDTNTKANSVSDDAYVFGTAAKLKGTERRRVLTFSHHLAYPSIEEKTLVKLTYVALSRARDELHIIAPSAGFPPYSLLYGSETWIRDPFSAPAASAKAAPVLVPGAKEETPVVGFPPAEVVELSEACLIPVAEGERLSVPALSLPETAGETARSGVFHWEKFDDLMVETALALQLKCDPRAWISMYKLGMGKSYEEVKAESIIKKNQLCPGLFSLQGPALVAKGRPPPGLEGWLHSSDVCERAYAVTLIRYTIEVGEWWHCSEHWMAAPRISVLRDYLSRLVLALPPWARDEVPVWGSATVMSLGPFSIQGEADLVFPEAEAVIEVKYGVHSNNHLRQAGIYASLLNLERAAVLNLKEGALIWVSSVPDVQAVRLTALATVAARAGYGVNGWPRENRAEIWGRRVVVRAGGAAIAFQSGVRPDRIWLAPQEHPLEGPSSQESDERESQPSDRAETSGEAVTWEAWLKELGVATLVLEAEKEAESAPKWLRDAAQNFAAQTTSAISPDFARAAAGVLTVTAKINWTGAL